MIRKLMAWAGTTALVALCFSPPTPALAQAAPITCGSTANLSTSSAATATVISGVSGQSIHLCGFLLEGGGTTNVTLEYGTGTNCATGTTTIIGPVSVTANAVYPFGGTVGQIVSIPAGNALCAVNSAAVQIALIVSYVQY